MNIEEARAVREERARYLHRLQSQEVWVEDLLGDVPGCLRGCTILKLLRAVRHLGETRVRTVLNKSGVDFTRKVGTLQSSEVQSILDELPPSTRKAKT